MAHIVILCDEQKPVLIGNGLVGLVLNHLKKICEAASLVLRGFGYGGPHLTQVLLPSLDEPCKRGLRPVPKDKEEHCAPFL